MMHCSGEAQEWQLYCSQSLLDWQSKKVRHSTQSFSPNRFAPVTVEVLSHRKESRRWPGLGGFTSLCVSSYLSSCVSLILWWLWAHWPGFGVLCVSVCLFMCFFMRLFILWTSLPWPADFSSRHTCDRNLSARMTTSTLQRFSPTKRAGTLSVVCTLASSLIPWSFENTGVIWECFGSRLCRSWRTWPQHSFNAERCWSWPAKLGWTSHHERCFKAISLITLGTCLGSWNWGCWTW